MGLKRRLPLSAMRLNAGAAGVKRSLSVRSPGSDSPTALKKPRPVAKKCPVIFRSHSEADMGHYPNEVTLGEDRIGDHSREHALVSKQHCRVNGMRAIDGDTVIYCVLMVGSVSHFPA